MSALEDRRQRAREAAHDRMCTHLQDSDSGCVTGVEQAIETATRVQITDELIEQCDQVHNSALGTSADRMSAALRAAFEARGFEVEE